MQQPFKEAFTFNKAERRGIFILLLIAFSLLLYDVFGPINWSYTSYQSNFEYQTERFLASQKKEVKKKHYFTEKVPKKPAKPRKRKIKPHPFDPNMMSHKQWLAMGLSEKQARTIEKYKRHGGSFRQPEDFKKIYCISEEEYEALSPYIIINVPDEDDLDFDITFQLNLNTVSMEEIQCVKGIGPAYAKRIIKYRDLLGGYTNVKQLYEVYGMDTVRYQQISPFFELSLDSINTISINTASYRQILKHPYISRSDASAICDYRKLHGKFKSVEDLKTLRIINDSLYQKIYLYFAL